MNIRLHHSPQHAAAPACHPIPFSFDGTEGRVTGKGPAEPLARGNCDTLEARIGAALPGAAPDALIGGALPFDRGADDCLWLCRGERTAARPATAAPPLALPDWRLTAEPGAAAYARAVARALDIMQAESGTPEALEKVVLARCLLVESARPIPVDALLSRLATDDSTTAFRVRLPQLQGAAHGRVLCGATPELLIDKTGRRVRSHPLAGSARRRADAVLDRDAAETLAQSGKDQREHALVVEAILDTLAPYCDMLDCPGGTRVTSTRSMWHLGTAIEGRLRDADMPSVLLASALHPTPAVCGVPRARAARLIDALEPVARDFYAGAVGWMDAQGDGAWYVAIRCAEISGPQARLYAGAGIVPGSDPMAETTETGAKFGALLAALGLPADAGLVNAGWPGHTQALTPHTETDE